MDFRLQQLDLSWYCQHRQLTWRFQPGLTGVLGPNGAGKSNAINAIYTALTNDFSRHPLGRAGSIAQQRPPGESSYIQLVAVVAGTPFSVKRSLNSDQHALLIGGKKISKLAEIQQELEGVLGLSRRFLDEYVFIPQGGLCSFILARAADRVRSFSRLCGTDVAERCWELLGETLLTDRKADVGPVQDEAFLQEQEQKALARQAELQRLLDAAQLALLPDDVFARIETQLIGAVSREDLQSQLDAATQTLAKRKAALEEARALFMTALEANKEAQKRVRQAEAAAQESQVVLQTLASREREAKARQRLERSLVSLEEPVSVEAVPASLLTRVDQLVIKYETQVAEYRKLAELDGDSPTCPTCGACGEDLLARIEQAKANLALGCKKLAAARQKQKDLCAQADAYTRWCRDFQLFEQRKKELEEQLAAIPLVVFSPEDQEARLNAQRAVEALEGAKARQVIAEEKMNQARDVLSRADASVEAQEEHNALLKRKLAGSNVLCQEEIKALQKKRAEHVAVQQAVAKYRAAMEEVQQSLERARAALADLQHASERRQRMRDWIQLNEKVREVFHRDSLPAMVHRAKLEEMEVSINRDLQAFDAPFKVSVAPDELNLMAHFRNGTVVPAQALSGGQKMMLSLGYRLATNTGLMILDEPTDGLDRANRDLAADVFLQLGRLAKARGHQVIIVTHDDVLSRCFDQTLELVGPE